MKQSKQPISRGLGWDDLEADRYQQWNGVEWSGECRLFVAG